MIVITFYYLLELQYLIRDSALCTEIVIVLLLKSYNRSLSQSLIESLCESLTYTCLFQNAPDYPDYLPEEDDDLDGTGKVSHFIHLIYLSVVRS